MKLFLFLYVIILLFYISYAISDVPSTKSLINRIEQDGIELNNNNNDINNNNPDLTIGGIEDMPQVEQDLLTESESSEDNLEDASDLDVNEVHKLVDDPAETLYSDYEHHKHLYSKLAASLFDDQKPKSKSKSIASATPNTNNNNNNSNNINAPRFSSQNTTTVNTTAMNSLSKSTLESQLQTDLKAHLKSIHHLHNTKTHILKQKLKNKIKQLKKLKKKLKQDKKKNNGKSYTKYTKKSSNGADISSYVHVHRKGKKGKQTNNKSKKNSYKKAMHKVADQVIRTGRYRGFSLHILHKIPGYQYMTRKEVKDMYALISGNYQYFNDPVSGAMKRVEKQTQPSILKQTNNNNLKNNLLNVAASHILPKLGPNNVIPINNPNAIVNIMRPSKKDTIDITMDSTSTVPGSESPKLFNALKEHELNWSNLKAVMQDKTTDNDSALGWDKIE